MPLAARIEQRTLLLASDGEPRLAIALDRGGRHRVIVPDAASAAEVVAALETCPGVGVLPANGGLLGTMTVAENLALALRYGADPKETAAGDWQHALQLALEACGLPPERIQGIARERPLALERSERWMIGFVRNLLQPPELLVLDRIFGGLSRRQANAVIALEAVYHDFHPFRPTLFVDIDAHELPAVPDCMSLELEAPACPC